MWEHRHRLGYFDNRGDSVYVIMKSLKGKEDEKKLYCRKYLLNELDFNMKPLKHFPITYSTKTLELPRATTLDPNRWGLGALRQIAEISYFLDRQLSKIFTQSVHQIAQFQFGKCKNSSVWEGGHPPPRPSPRSGASRPRLRCLTIIDHPPPLRTDLRHWF